MDAGDAAAKELMQLLESIDPGGSMGAVPGELEVRGRVRW
jgi:hypothetical protein